MAKKITPEQRAAFGALLHTGSKIIAGVIQAGITGETIHLPTQDQANALIDAIEKVAEVID